MATPRTVENQQLNAGMHRRSSLKRQLWNYGVAIALVLTALLLMLAVDPYIQVRNTTFLIFHAALTLAAWYGGRNAGILATVLSAFLATYFFVDPIFSLSVTFASAARLLIFVLQGILISVLVGALRTAQQQSKRSLKLQEAAFYEQQAALRELQQTEEVLRRSAAQLANEASSLIRLNEASSRLWQKLSLNEGLDEMLAATIALLGADMGNIQILDGDRGVLYIAAHSGFQRDFLDFFREVSTEDDSACGRALRSGERTIIEDVEVDAPYTPLRPIARAAGYRAVQSTPLMGRDGTPLGMFSTHWRSPHQPSEQDLRRLDLYVRQAADFIEYSRAETALRRAAELDAFRVSLTDALRPLADPVEIQATACRLLGEYLGVNRVTYFEVRGADYVVERDYVNGADALAGSYPIDSFGDRLLAAYRTGRPVSSPSVAADPYLSPEQQSAYTAIQIGAYIGVPLVKGGKFVAGLAVHTIAPRDWKPEEVALTEEVADRTWASVERARAEVALRASENMLGGIVGSITDALVMVDNDWRYIFVNEEFLHRIGMSLADVIGHNIWELFPDAVGNTAYTQLHRAMAERIPVEYEVLYEPYQRWYSDKAYPTPDGGLTVYSQDITDRKRIEGSLRTSEEQLRLATEGANLGMWYWDVTTDSLIWSDQAKAMFGLPVDIEISMGVFLEAVHPDDRQLIQTILSDLQAGQSHTEDEYRTQWPDGTVRWIFARGNYTYDEDGNLASTRGVLMDITDRKQAEARLRQQEAELRESERRFRRLVESSLFGVAFGDFAGGIHYANDYFLNLIGYSREEIETGQVQWTEITPDKFLPLDQAAMLELRSQGVAKPFEKEFIRKDGSQIPILIGSALLQEPFDQQQEIVAFFLDLTERKQAEAQIQRSQAIAERQLMEIEAIYHTAPIGLAILGTDLRFLRINQQLAEINGISVEDHIGRTVREVVPELADQVEALFRQVLATGEPLLNLEISGETKAQSGIRRTWIENWYPLKDVSGQVIGINAVVQEITDRKQAEVDRERILQQEQAAREAAENANRVKDEFLAVLSHELRSPLNPILGWSKLLQKGDLNPAKTKTALATIERNTQLQAQLIDDLLDIARILRGKLSLNEAAVDLGFVISSALETVRLAAEAKALHVEVNLPTQVRTAMGDAGRLQQVVWNLLSNAVKFTPQGGQITIALTQSESFAQIQVTDTGKGIHPDFLPFVFEHFRQEDGATTRKFGGLGLGLAIARQIVELHGGTIAVESAGEGQGATFTVRLPLLRSQGEGEKGRRGEGEKAPPHSLTPLPPHGITNPGGG